MSDDTQPMERDLQVIISKKIAASLEKYGGADEFYFHFGIAIMPGPQGVVAVAALSISLPNPLLGTGDMMMSLVIQDMSQMRNDEAVDELIMNSVKTMREEKAKLLANPTSPGGGILVP